MYPEEPSSHDVRRMAERARHLAHLPQQSPLDHLEGFLRRLLRLVRGGGD